MIQPWMRKNLSLQGSFCRKGNNVFLLQDKGRTQLSLRNKASLWIETADRQGAGKTRLKITSEVMAHF